MAKSCAKCPAGVEGVQNGEPVWSDELVTVQIAQGKTMVIPALLAQHFNLPRHLSLTQGKTQIPLNLFEWASRHPHHKTLFQLVETASKKKRDDHEPVEEIQS